MKLEILSNSEALKYDPQDKSFSIRIITEFGERFVDDLKENKNWIGEERYYFDDIWPIDWKEYSYADLNDPYFGGILSEKWADVKETYPKMTKDSLMGYIESRGHPYARYNLFDEKLAKKILDGFEKAKGSVETVVISSSHGKHRPAGLGIAMNEIYDWGLEGLKENFFDYRRYVYQTMLNVSKKK